MQKVYTQRWDMFLWKSSPYSYNALFPLWASLVTQANHAAAWGPRFDPWVGRPPWRRAWHLQYSCWKFPGTRAWPVLPTIGWQVRHDWADKHIFLFITASLSPFPLSSIIIQCLLVLKLPINNSWHCAIFRLSDAMPILSRLTL